MVSTLELRNEQRYWQQVCRDRSRTTYLQKAAAVGDDTEFETALANLAHATLRQQAPRLLDYELGFQLVEKSDDNEKAVGVFGFMPGDQLLYGPVFFIRGQLKGHELLYLKESDTFVPMSEAWVDYLLARKPIILGKSISQADTSRSSRRPNLDQLRVSPTFKGASDNWLETSLPLLKAAGDFSALPEFEPLLPKLIAKHSKYAAMLIDMWDRRPDMLETFDQMYGRDFMQQTIKRAADYQANPTADDPKPEPKPVQKKVAADRFGGKLKIHVYDGWYDPGLSDELRQKLATDRVVIEDNREKHAQVFDGEDLQPMSLTTPNETGVYSLLSKPGDFERCFVAISPKRPYGDAFSVVVKLSGSGRPWRSVNVTELWADDREPEETFRTWFDTLPAASTLADDDTYLLVGPQGDTIGPFVVSSSLPSTEGETCKRVWFTSTGYCSPGRMLESARHGLDQSYANYGEACVISVGVSGGKKVVERGSTYFVPGAWKALKLSNDTDKTDDKFRPGSLVDFTLGVQAKFAELKVLSDGYESEINGRRMAQHAAKLHLVREHGMREKTAVEVLKLAQLRNGSRFRVKYADGGAPDDQYGGGFMLPNFPQFESRESGGLQSQYQQTAPEEYNIDVPSTYPPDPRAITEPPSPDPDMLNQIMQASQTGQREVLDTSAVALMLRTNRSENLIDQFLGDLLKGLDRIGRLLFNFYWKNEVFADRYGENEMKELEDLLRTSFENVGDLTLKLRQETIEPMPGQTLGSSDPSFAVQGN